MSHRLRARWSCGTVLMLAASAAAAGPATTPASGPARPPPFAGPAPPTPPRQHDPWPRPSTTLPAVLVDDTALLFDQGMADPRGGEYRAVGVVTGNCRGGAAVTDTNGWVLPAASGQRFAVGWNGLVYPCVTVGDKADLAADVAAMLAADRKARDAWAKSKVEHDPQFRHRYSRGTAEAEPVAVDSLMPIKACLLLRLGEAKLAESYWPAVADDTRPVDGRQQLPDDPYLALSDEWAWCAFDRAVCAHARGDDVVGRDTAKLLSAALPQIEATDAGKGFARPTVGVEGTMVANGPYIGFADELPDLLADEQRRTAEAPARRMVDHPHDYPDQPKRIAALIRDLEVVSDRHSDGAFPSLLDDRVPQALIHEGEPSVDALIDCVANDHRLTRTLWASDDPRRWRYVVPTAKAAYDILQVILEVDRFGDPAKPPFFQGRADPEVADQIRAYYATVRGKPLAERWYETLADDGAGPDRWIAAADRLAEPVDVEYRPGYVASSQREPGAGTPMKGEPLRAKRDPSVSDLLAERVSAIAAMGTNSSESDAIDVAVDLFWWDARASVPVLREQLQRCIDTVDHAQASNAEHAGDPNWPDNSSVVGQAEAGIGRLTTALAAAGDADGVRRYAPWLLRQRPATVGRAAGPLLQPIWRNPDNADLAAAAETLFNGPASPWRTASAVPLLTDGDQPSLYRSPMFGIPAFRRRVHRDLQDVTVIGSAQLNGDGEVVHIDHEHGGVEEDSGNGGAGPPAPTSRGAAVPVRVCDWCASDVSRLDGAPPFELTWPLDRRDGQRAKLLDFLDRWGDRFRIASPGADDFARMSFPHRDVPATPDDVRRATAIFTLAGGPVRVIPLPSWPALAKRVAPADHPAQRQGDADAKAGGSDDATDDLDVGLVWQAEEVQVDGRWQRFYGFVGSHTIAKVPAEQMQFVTEP